MPAGQDDAGGRKAKGHRQWHQARSSPMRPAGGSYGDQEPQYGTSAPKWKEPMPGHDERGDFGAGGEAFGSTSGQGRYDDEGQARQSEKPEHPAWQPFGQPEASHPTDSQTGRSRDAPLDAQYRDWGDRAMRRHDEEYRAFRAEKQRSLDAEFEEWRKARKDQATEPFPSKD